MVLNDFILTQCMQSLAISWAVDLLCLLARPCGESKWVSFISRYRPFLFISSMNFEIAALSENKEVGDFAVSFDDSMLGGVHFWFSSTLLGHQYESCFLR